MSIIFVPKSVSGTLAVRLGMLLVASIALTVVFAFAIGGDLWRWWRRVRC